MTKYYINYAGGSLNKKCINFEGKKIFLIGPTSEKDILKNLSEDFDYIVCISNDPYKSCEFYNLPDGAIIYTSFFPHNQNTKKILFDLIEKKNIHFLTSQYLWEKVKNNYIFSFNVKNVENIIFTSIETDKKILDVNRNILKSHWPSSGFFCILSFYYQNPSKLSINGFTFFNSDFNKYSNDEYNKQFKDSAQWLNTNCHNIHNFKNEFNFLLKNIFLSSNILIDNILKKMIDDKDIDDKLCN